MRNLMFNLTLALLLAGVYVILGGCTDKSDDQTDPFTFEPTKDQFKSGALNVGSIVNIDSVRNAILLGARQVNEAGGILGKELNLLALKARDTEHAVSLAQEMFEYDIKLVNVSYSSRSKAVAALAIPKGIPIISESATSTFFTDFNDDDLYFRMVPSDVYQAQLLALLAREAGHETAITVHNDTDQYGETLISLFSSEFEELGGRVLEQVAVPFSVTQGFATYIQPILQLSPDVVLNVVLEADESANFVNEALQAGVSSRFLFPDASAGIPAFANNLVDAEAIADDLGTAPCFGLVTNPQMMFFDQAYRQTFDTAPSTFDVNGYDFVMIAAWRSNMRV